MRFLCENVGNIPDFVQIEFIEAPLESRDRKSSSRNENEPLIHASGFARHGLHVAPSVDVLG
jgi:hypothetical protein